jgi:hypothetical protein
MAKGKGGKPSTQTGPNSTRNNGKKSKQNPLDGTSGRGKHTGRTVGGYSPEKLAIRAAKRTHVK